MWELREAEGVTTERCPGTGTAMGWQRLRFPTGRLVAECRECGGMPTVAEPELRLSEHQRLVETKSPRAG